jgi:hypothetical protein
MASSCRADEQLAVGKLKADYDGLGAEQLPEEAGHRFRLVRFEV